MSAERIRLRIAVDRKKGKRNRNFLTKNYSCFDIRSRNRLQFHEMLLSAAEPSKASAPPLCSWSSHPQLSSANTGGAALLSDLLKYI